MSSDFYVGAFFGFLCGALFTTYMFLIYSKSVVRKIVDKEFKMRHINIEEPTTPANKCE
jgi:hypothetical protein